MYRKNVSGQYIYFCLVSATDGSAQVGATVTAKISIDGGAQATAGGSTTSLGGGQYKFALATADTNGNNISLMFTATGCVPVEKTFLTTACDPTAATNFGITSLPTVVSGSNGAIPTTGTGVNQIADSATALSTLLGRVSGNVALAASLPTHLANLVIDSSGNITANITGNLTGSVNSVTSIVTANMTQIDGQATNGNHATLNLKSLNIQRNDGQDTVVIASNSLSSGNALNVGALAGAAIVLNAGSLSYTVTCDTGRGLQADITGNINGVDLSSGVTLADNAITTAKIADGALTSAKFTVASPTGVQTGILEKLNWIYRNIFCKTSKTITSGDGSITYLADDGTTAILDQPIHSADNGATQTRSAAVNH